MIENEVQLAKQWEEDIDRGRAARLDTCRCINNTVWGIPCYHQLVDEGFISNREPFPLSRIGSHWRLLNASDLESEAAAISSSLTVDRVAPPNYPAPSASQIATQLKRKAADDQLAAALRGQNLPRSARNAPSQPTPTSGNSVPSSEIAVPSQCHSLASFDKDVPVAVPHPFLSLNDASVDHASLTRSRKAAEALPAVEEREEWQSRRLRGMKGLDAGFGLNGSVHQIRQIERSIDF